MKKIKNILLFGLLLFPSPVLLSQNTTPVKILPPSPEAAALGKYGIEPVGMYTGTANVTVPIYTLQTKHLNLPISLNYSSNGIKVDELSTRVGMTWTLFAGGAVTRTVYDRADEINGRAGAPPSSNFNYTSANPDPQLLLWLEDIVQNQKDGQFDEYNFNFAGYSGKFIIDLSGQVKLLPYSNLKIEYQSSRQYPPASMETAQASAEESIYMNLSQTRSDKPSGYPNDTYTNPNNKVSKVRGDGNKIGPGIVLKIMAGDRFNIRLNAWYNHTNGSYNFGSPADPLTDIAAALVSSVPGASGGKVSGSSLTQSIFTPAVTEFLYDQYTNEDNHSTQPKAFLNWMFLDEQFNFDSSSSHFVQVGGDEQFVTLLINTPVAEKNGYVYLYCSNVSTAVDVYFDNLEVTHISGPVLEETHYYPFGLTMAGINSKTLKSNYTGNRNKFNGKELQSNEFSDGSGLEMYDFGARKYDPQIGRWWKIDPMVEKNHSTSPYAFVANNPIKYLDPTGKDTVLYREFGGQHVNTRVGGKGKTPIYVIDDELAILYKDNPELLWKFAKPVQYSVGEGTVSKGYSGSKLKKEHPLSGKGWKAGDQVYLEDLMDLSRQFDEVIDKGKSDFTELKTLPKTSRWGYLSSKRAIVFGLMVKPGAVYDLKSENESDGTKSFGARITGQYSILHGTLRQHDDYGNISFGIYGKYAGFTEWELLNGANVAQLADTQSKDPKRDQLMIRTGVFNYENYIKKN